MSPPQGRVRMRQLVAQHALMVSVVLLCVLFAAALGSGPRSTGVALPTVNPTAANAPQDKAAVPTPSSSPTPTAAPSAPQRPPAFGYVLGGLLVLAALTLVWSLVRLLLRMRAGRVRVCRSVSDFEPESDTPNEEAVREQMRAAVREGLREADDGDPRGAVIGCWVRLEQAAASAGTERHAGDTPADLGVRLLDAHQISADALDRLALLYRRARYAPDEVAESMRDEATETLSLLASELSEVGA